MAAFWRRGEKPVDQPPKARPAVCVTAEENDMNVGLTYDNANITVSGT